MLKDDFVILKYAFINKIPEISEKVANLNDFLSLIDQGKAMLFTEMKEDMRAKLRTLELSSFNLES